jgi:acetyltransferase
MTIRNLDQMLAPSSVVLIGASPQAASVGHKITRNLLAGGYSGSIALVNPRHDQVLGVKCYPSVAALPWTPDLAVIATPPATIPSLISQLGERGTRAAIVITAGVKDVKQAMLDASRPYCLRILGPNCLGLMLPHLGLDASFSHCPAPKGDLAFLSQSGALITAVVDWAAGRNLGFSHVVSLGDMADVDFGDMLDYLAGDTKSRAILMYMEALTNAPKFISAARRAARSKPVIVVKSGRHEAGARAALSHTGALAGSDAAYDAAFRRTGVLRVRTLPDLFAAAEMLSRTPRLTGERLMILTNGGGAGVLAADELQDAGGTLAALSPDTTAALDAVLPPTWSRANPVDIIGDAGPTRYEAALKQLLADPDNDAVLVMQCPTALASPIDNARTVADTFKAPRDHRPAKPLLTCWLGDGAAREPRDLFAKEGIATFETPSDAITGFMQLVRHARAQTELMQAPPNGSADEMRETGKASGLIAAARSAGRTMLTSVESKAILGAEGIPVVETRIAATAGEVGKEAAHILQQNAACVVKILSTDISHKSDVGGVRLGLESAEAAVIAAKEMLTRVAARRPDARVEGFMVEPMVRRPDALETIVGMSVDQTFGPLLMFGAGGTAVEVIADRALALPPIDRLLAKQMIAETRIARLLAGYRDTPAANLDALSDVLVRVSHLIIRHPEIIELDINPLLVDDKGVIGVDARIRLAAASAAKRPPLAIRPYPAEWATAFDAEGLGRVALRPVRPADEHLYGAFFARISSEDLRLRFFTPKVHLSHHFLARLTQIDYAREMAFAAVLEMTGELIGVVRLVMDPDLWRGEYGILLRSDMKGRGLGWRMMNQLIEYARAEGVGAITGLVLAENTTMIDMARKLGFRIKPVEGDHTVVEVEIALQPSRDGEG